MSARAEDLRDRSCETVMLVADDGGCVVCEELRADGFAVLLVPGVPQAAAAVLAGFRPDAVLLHLSPRADASELRQVLCRTPGLRDVPVLVGAHDGAAP